MTRRIRVWPLLTTKSNGRMLRVVAPPPLARAAERAKRSGLRRKRRGATALVWHVSHVTSRAAVPAPAASAAVSIGRARVVVGPGSRLRPGSRARAAGGTADGSAPADGFSLSSTAATAAAAIASAAANVRRAAAALLARQQVGRCDARTSEGSHPHLRLSRVAAERARTRFGVVSFGRTAPAFPPTPRRLVVFIVAHAPCGGAALVPRLPPPHDLIDGGSGAHISPCPLRSRARRRPTTCGSTRSSRWRAREAPRALCSSRSSSRAPSSSTPTTRSDPTRMITTQYAGPCEVATTPAARSVPYWFHMPKTLHYF